MRILLIADIDEHGGTGEYFNRVVEYLRCHHELHVAFHPGVRKVEAEKFLSERGISWSRDYVLWPALDDLFRRFFRRLNLVIFYLFFRDSCARIYLERKYRPDGIVVSQGGGFNYFAFLLSSRPVFFIMHSLFSQPSSANRGGRIYLRLFSSLNSSSRCICCVSRFALDQFRENIQFKLLSSCAIAIPNYARDFLGAHKDQRSLVTILTLGHVVGYKNPELWFKVAQTITTHFGPQVRFIWAGTGSMLKEMRACAAGSDSISFIGYREPQELYQEADIYFQPSIWESQGIAVVEALSAALPCVVSNVGGLPESVDDGIEGFVCDVAAEYQYIEALTRLIGDEKLRHRMGCAARAKYERQFTRAIWEVAMNETLTNLFEER